MHKRDKSSEKNKCSSEKERCCCSPKKHPHKPCCSKEESARGPQGPMGIKGPKGISIVGPQGFRGFKGNKGPQGDDGYQGSQGFIGIQGITGQIGYQGTAEYGYQGEMGPQGDIGLAGACGYQGFQGYGPQGPEGYQGYQGLMGFQGDPVTDAIVSPSLASSTTFEYWEIGPEYGGVSFQTGTIFYQVEKVDKFYSIVFHDADVLFGANVDPSKSEFRIHPFDIGLNLIPSTTAHIRISAPAELATWSEFRNDGWIYIHLNSANTFEGISLQILRFEYSILSYI